VLITAMVAAASHGLGGGPIAVVYVEVEDCDPADRGMSGNCVRCPYHNIVQKAKAHSPVRLGVVAWRADETEGIRCGACGRASCRADSVHCSADATRAPQDCFARSRASGRVAVKHEHPIFVDRAV
jgi:uncharacterized ferredoxin-like protein